jgi:hypothetical protein
MQLQAAHWMTGYLLEPIDGDVERASVGFFDPEVVKVALALTVMDFCFSVLMISLRKMLTCTVSTMEKVLLPSVRIN